MRRTGRSIKMESGDDTRRKLEYIEFIKSLPKAYKEYVEPPSPFKSKPIYVPLCDAIAILARTIGSIPEFRRAKAEGNRT